MLNQKHSVLIGGMEVVDAIVARPLSGETPVDPLSFTVEVREK